MVAEVMPWIAFVAGIAVVLATATSVIVTLIVPRGTRSVVTKVLRWFLDMVFRQPVMRLHDYLARDRFLSLQAPIFLVLQLASWLGLFYAGFALMMSPWVDGIGAALRLSGSSMFTLGFANSVGDSGALLAICFGSAAVGMVVVALQISYLPTIYGAFNRRETLVTMLESRGGEPVWGPEILARHVLVDIVDNLPILYAEWERWAADLDESHSTYPVLMYMRSPTPLRSWVIGLLAVLDAAALQNALNPLTAPSECRLVLRMGFTALRDLARVVGVPYNNDPRPDDPLELTEEDFRQAVDHLVAAGWVPERSAEEAWIHFRGWRTNYETAAYGIADLLDAPPALWSGPRRHEHVRATAPRRPMDRRPEERREMSRVAAKRRAIRSAQTGSNLPAAVRAALRRRIAEDEAAGGRPTDETAVAREALAVLGDDQQG